MILPPEAAPLLTLFAAEFTAPTAARFHTLLAAALLTTGRRTVAGHTGRTVHGKARPPRPGSLVARLHRLALRPQVGRPGSAGEVPLRKTALSVAGARRSLPAARREPSREPPAPPAQLMCRLLRQLLIRVPGRRFVFASDSAHWHKAGQRLVAIRWVSVRDRSGTHRDEYFYATDPTLTPAQIIGSYCGRWSIETTFHRDARPPGC